MKLNGLQRVQVTQQKQAFTEGELTELQRLKRENAKLKEKNDLLKKVATVSGGSPAERFGFIERYRSLGVR